MEVSRGFHLYHCHVWLLEGRWHVDLISLACRMIFQNWEEANKQMLSQDLTSPDALLPSRIWTMPEMQQGMRGTAWFPWIFLVGFRQIIPLPQGPCPFCPFCPFWVVPIVFSSGWIYDDICQMYPCGTSQHHHQKLKRFLDPYPNIWKAHCWNPLAGEINHAEPYQWNRIKPY